MARGLAIEVFATEDAAARYAPSIAGVPVQLVTERAAKALSDTVTPVGTGSRVRAAHDRIWPMRSGRPETGGRRGRHFRTGQRRHPDPHRRCDGRGGGCAGGARGGSLQRQVPARIDGQHLRPAGRLRTRRRRRGHRSARGGTAGAGHHGRRRDRPCRRRSGRADRVAVRPRGAGPARGGRGPGRPAGSHRDARQRREPERGCRSGDLPVPERAGAPRASVARACQRQSRSAQMRLLATCAASR